MVMRALLSPSVMASQLGALEWMQGVEFAVAMATATLDDPLFLTRDKRVLYLGCINTSTQPVVSEPAWLTSERGISYTS
jgi:hypothetical protein